MSLARLLCHVFGHAPERLDAYGPNISKRPLYGTRCERSGCDAVYLANGWQKVPR